MTRPLMRKPQNSEEYWMQRTLVILGLLLLPATARAVPLWALCMAAMEKLSRLQGEYNDLAPIDLAGLTAPRFFGRDGLPVMDSQHGAIVLTALEPQTDGTVTVKYRKLSDSPAKASAIETKVSPAGRQIAPLGSAAARVITEQRVAKFLENAQVAKEADIIPLGMAVLAMVDHSGSLADSLDSLRHAGGPAKIDERFASLWQQYQNVHTDVEGQFPQVLAIWLSETGFFLKLNEHNDHKQAVAEKGTPVPAERAKRALEDLRGFIHFVHQSTGQNLPRSGAVRFGDIRPHLNLGVEILNPGGTADFSFPSVYVPHDVYINLVTNAWNQSGKLTGSRAGELALNTYDASQKDVKGTPTHLLNEFKKKPTPKTLSALVDPRAAEITQWLSNQGVGRKPVVIIPMPSHTGAVSAANLAFAEKVGQLAPGEALVPQAALLHPGVRSTQRTQPFLWKRVIHAQTAFKEAEAPSLQGLTVVLTDDVVTSGATLEAAKDVLYEQGAAKVVVVTLAGSEQTPPVAVTQDFRPSHAPSLSEATVAMVLNQMLPKPVKITTKQDLVRYFATPAEKRPKIIGGKNPMEMLAAQIVHHWSPEQTYGALREIPDLPTLQQILRASDVLHSPPPNKPWMKYDVNFMVDHYNQIVAENPQLDKDKINAYQRLILESVLEIKSFEMSLGAYPNNLSDAAKKALPKIQGALTP